MAKGDLVKFLSPELWNPEKILWKKALGKKGEYERSEDVNNLEFKKMLQEINKNGGTLNRDGKFYWTFYNGYTVGRKNSDDIRH